MAKRKYSGKITDILLQHKVITPPMLDDAEQEARVAGVRLEKYLVEKKLVKSVDMTLALSEYLKMPPITLAHYTPDPSLLELIPREVMAKRLIMPVNRLGKSLTIALGDPFDLMAIDEIATITGLHVTPLAAPEEEIGAVLGKVFE